MTRYGLYDTVDKCWLGSADGPRIFDEKDLAALAESSGKPLSEIDLLTVAEIAAQMANTQLKLPIGRVRAVAYQEGEVHLKDTKETFMSPEEALRRIEGG